MFFIKMYGIGYKTVLMHRSSWNLKDKGGGVCEGGTDRAQKGDKKEGYILN